MNEWLTNQVNSTLRVPLQARWRELITGTAQAVTGVVTGLTVSCDDADAALGRIRVGAGAAVVNGTECFIDDELVIVPVGGIEDGTKHYVCISVSQHIDSALDTFGKSVWVRRYTDFDVVVFRDAEYNAAVASANATDGNAVLCLGRVVWEVTDTVVVCGGVSYPMRVRAVGSDLAEFDTPAYRAAGRIGDVVAVMEIAAPQAMGLVAVRLYRLDNRVDPVRCFVTVPGIGRTEVSGLWVQNPNLSSSKLWTVSCLVNGVTLFPDDADVPDTRRWMQQHDAGSDTVEYLTSMLRFTATAISHDSESASEFVPDIATAVSAADHEHRNAVGSAPESSVNPHRLTCNDVGLNETTPLLRGLFNVGFAVAHENVAGAGIIGELAVETTAGCNVRIDWLGTRTGRVGAKYIVTEHTPRSIAYVTATASDTAVVAIAHEVINGVVVIPDTVVAGSFANYVEFNPRQTYAAGDMVAVTVSGTVVGTEKYRRLYRCDFFYNPVVTHAGQLGPAVVEPDGSLSGGGALLFTEQVRVTSIVVGYYYVADNEFMSDPVGTSSIRFRPNTKQAVVAQGRVIDAQPNRGFGQFNMHALTGLPVKALALSLDKDYEIQASVAVCDRAVLSERTASKWTASGSGISNAIPTFSTSRQVKLTAVSTPNASNYFPPAGRCGVTRASLSKWAGNVKLLYVYGVNASDVAVLNTASAAGLRVDATALPFDATNAVLVDGNSEIIAREYWSYTPSTGAVSISDSVFRTDNSYGFRREAYESPRSFGIFAAKGTKKFAGTPAVARISVRAAQFLDVGDSITISCADTVTGIKFSATKTARNPTAVPAPAARTPKQFDIGATPALTAANLAACLNADPAFNEAGFAATAVVGTSSPSLCYVVVTTPAGARFNTVASVSVSSAYNGIAIKSTFSGGADHTWSISDLVGMEVFVDDAIPKPDHNCYWSVYCTGDLDSGADASTFYRIAYVDASMSDNVDPSEAVLKHTITADDIAGTLDTIVLGTEFSATITITGTDSSGASVAETVTLSRDTFTDLTDSTATSTVNDDRWVRLQNQFVRVESWTALDVVAAGNAELVIVAESGADAGSCYGLAQLDWNGSSITSVSDTREIVTSQTRRVDALAIGEAMAQASTLLTLAR